MNTLTIFIIAFITLSFGTAAGFANDMWSETPDLNNLTTPSFIEAARLSNRPPKADMWAETPDLDNNDSVDFHSGKTVFISGPVDPELYKETPNLNNVSPGKSTLLPPDEVMVAGQMNMR